MTIQIRELTEEEFQTELEHCGDSDPLGLVADGEVIGFVNRMEAHRIALVGSDEVAELIHRLETHSKTIDRLLAQIRDLHQYVGERTAVLRSPTSGRVWGVGIDMVGGEEQVSVIELEPSYEQGAPEKNPAEDVRRQVDS